MSIKVEEAAAAMVYILTAPLFVLPKIVYLGRQVAHLNDPRLSQVRVEGFEGESAEDARRALLWDMARVAGESIPLLGVALRIANDEETFKSHLYGGIYKTDSTFTAEAVFWGESVQHNLAFLEALRTAAAQGR